MQELKAYPGTFSRLCYTFPYFIQESKEGKFEKKRFAKIQPIKLSLGSKLPEIFLQFMS